MHPKYWHRGRKAIYQAPTDGEASGGSAPLDAHSAGAALASLLGDDEGQAESAVNNEQESPEAAAERLAADEAGANHEAEADGEKDGDNSDASETVTVLVDGKPVQLTKEQIAEAHKGYLRQQDYTRKTTEVAEQRKTADAEIQKARTERDQYAQGLQRLLAVNQHLDAQAQQWTPEQIDADPVGYMQYQHAAQTRAQQTQQALSELNQIEQQMQAESQQAAREHQAQQLEAIRAKLPAWKDEAVMKAEVSEIKQWMYGQGFTDADLASMRDHRMVLLARSAMKHEQLLERAKKTAQQVAKTPPKVEAPGRTPVAPTDGRTVAMKRLKASGSVQDAAAALSLLS